MAYRIPFNIPYVATNQSKYVLQAISSRHASGDGPFSSQVTNFLQKIYRNSSNILLTPSCTASLEMCALLLDIKPGDEVILPSFTFVSTANAFALRGAEIIFCDVNAQSLVIEPQLVKPLINKKTKAVVVVQYAGFGYKLNELRDLCDRHDICLIEDAAQSIGAQHNGNPVGSYGHLSTISFHETKNIHCGEGGALVINDSKYSEQAEIIREKGTNRSKFFRNQVDKYTWQSLGSSYLLSDIQASMLLAQLEDLEMVTSTRRMQFQTYFSKLSLLNKYPNISIASECDNNLGNGHIFYIIMESQAQRSQLINHLRLNSISAIFHYVPLHLSPFGEKYRKLITQMPVTESISERLLRLPMYFGVDVEKVSDCVLDFFSKAF